MKKIIALVALACIPFFGNAQLQYNKVKIYATNAELAEISSYGVTIDHGTHRDNTWFIADFSQLDIDIMDLHGVTYEVLIEDVATYYEAHINDTDVDLKTDRADCDGGTGGGFTPSTPENFELGSMGGYFTYEEYLAELDAMHAAYPDLITEKAGISDFETWEGRPIHWVRISDNASVDEDEEEVLYTAIHHAREPMSLSQTIFWMWYVLENYGTDEEITYLVDNTEMYCVPMINPDGYKYNHTTNPGGGGMHRKNRNPSVGSSNKGVDLNRNYSYHWNESGTSPDENSDVYAGSGPFSEPETQAIKWFCENHNFKFAHNAHAHGDLLLFPIGWATAEFADDHDYFQTYSNHMAIHNGYSPVKATDLYPAAGDSDDWMYVDEPEIFAMTPEVGDAFWPPSSAIIPTCKEMLFPNKVMAHLPHVYGVATDLGESRIEAMTGDFTYEIERLGLTDGDFTVTMTPLVGITSITGVNTHTLAIMGTEEGALAYELEAGIAFGDEIKYVINTDNGTWVKHDTIIKSFGAGTPIFTDEIGDLFNWSGDWDITDETFFSASNCITDSPYDDTYGNNVEKYIELDESFDFSGASYAYVTFNAKWEIENDYDYVEFLASTNGGATWTPLCGNYTNTGVSDQDAGEPLYDGFQLDWVSEEVNLSDYIDQDDVRFAFVLISDGFVQEDGFYFDDFSVYTDGGTGSGLKELNETTFNIYPNPANDLLYIKIDPAVNVQSLTILNELGQTIQAERNAAGAIDISNLAEGVYFIQVIDNDNASVTNKFVVLR